MAFVSALAMACARDGVCADMYGRDGVLKSESVRFRVSRSRSLELATRSVEGNESCESGVVNTAISILISH